MDVSNRTTLLDPPAPADGSCAYCGKQHRPPKPGRLHQTIAALDPFHSTECCRAWHGFALAGTREVREDAEPWTHSVGG